jgi:acetylcholinesterase
MLHLLVLALLAALPSTSAIPLASPPTVHSRAGIFHGVHLPTFGQDAFLGIKYAPKPARFSPAKLSADAPDTHFNASRYGTECMAYGGDTAKLVAMPGNQTRLGEDCLHLNIVRPQGVDEEGEEEEGEGGLPVLLWIYGGGWVAGSTSDPRYVRLDWRNRDVRC